MPSIPWNIRQVAALAGGRLTRGGDQVPTRVYIDSRQPAPGGLFVALTGERFDGHAFAAGAVLGGASAVMVERELEDVEAPQIVVPDTLRALQTLGSMRRELFAGRVAAVTGSTGKTTTRTMLAAILGVRSRVLQPRKNFNNHIGVPLTLLELDADHEAIVLELGCSDFFEIDRLAEISRPDVGLITNVGPAHLERLGDLDGVARAKGELFARLGARAVAVVNLDDPRVSVMRTAAGRRVTFGVAEGAGTRLLGRAPMGIDGQRISLEHGADRFEAVVPMPGAHNATDALAAAAAAFEMGATVADVAAGLAVVPRTPGRLDLVLGPAGSLLVDDTYNANPASMMAALGVLPEVGAGGRIMAVRGDMLELGAATDEAHLGVGRIAGGIGLHMLVTMGEGARRIGEGAVAAGLDRGRWIHVESHRRAALAVAEILRSGDALLIKGSRGMGMENVVGQLRRDPV